MKKHLPIFFLFLCPFFGLAQQLPYASPFTSMQFTANPAMTAVWNYWEIGANYRQQWAGFNDAPTTVNINGQYPFVDQNMSLGAFIELDKVGPLKTSRFAVSYAYKMNLGIAHKDQLSIGVMGTLSEYQVNENQVVATDMTDIFLPTMTSSELTPNAGIGLFYTTNGEDNFAENLFFFGLGANQLLNPTIPVFGDGVDGKLERVFHGNATMGVRIINGDIAIEPSAWLNFAAMNLYNVNLGLRMEKEGIFDAGLIYTTNQTLALQFGLNIKHKMLKDGALRVGTLGTYNIGTAGAHQGLGYEFFMGYRFWN